MDASRIVPNRALRDLIAEYNVQQLQNTTSSNNNISNNDSLGVSSITVPTIETITKFIKSPFNGNIYMNMFAKSQLETIKIIVFQLHALQLLMYLDQ
jgi:hypothetical protein